MLVDLAPVGLVRITQRHRRHPVVAVDVLRLRLVAHLSRRELGGVPGVRSLHRPAAHARETATQRLGQVVALVLAGPDSRLVHHRERDRRTQTRGRLRRDRLDNPAIRQEHASQAGVRDQVVQRTALDHRNQMPVHVVGLVIGRRRDLDTRSRPRLPDRTPLSVPAGEHRRADRLGADDRRRQRTLAPLLRADQDRTTVEERGRELPVTRLRIQPVVMFEERPHLLGQQERLAAVLSVRDHAVRFDPLSDLDAQGRNLVRLLRLPRHRQPPADDAADASSTPASR